MLATEYCLLKAYEIDYSQTREELYYALAALERLDYTAEKYYRTPQVSQSSDLNGFMIRSDVPKDAKTLNPNWSNFIIYSNFFGYRADKLPYEMSKDNVWNILLNLALVVKLVDDVPIQNSARQIAHRLVKWMHCENCDHVEYWAGFLCSGCWLVKNAVTGHRVEDGGDVDEIPNPVNPCHYVDGFSYGFACAGNWIARYDGNPLNYGTLHFNNSFDQKQWFYLNATSSSIESTENGRGNYRFRCLATVFSDDVDATNYSYYRNLRFMRGDDGGKWPHEHLPLIWRLLHGASVDIQRQSEVFFDEIAYYEYILNDCPSNGIYFKYETRATNPSKYWVTNNRLTKPFNKNDEGNQFDGEYSGIDYMLLHNLFWLCHYLPRYGGTKTTINTSFPNFMYDTYADGSKVSPLAIGTLNLAEVNSTFSSNTNVVINSGGKIIFGKGFKVEKGGEFKAYSNSMPPYLFPWHLYTTKQYPKYKKISIDPSTINLLNIKF